MGPPNPTRTYTNSPRIHQLAFLVQLLLWSLRRRWFRSRRRSPSFQAGNGSILPWTWTDQNLSIGLCSWNLLSPLETFKAYLPPPTENPGEHGAAAPEASWCERSPEEGARHELQVIKDERRCMAAWVCERWTFVKVQLEHRFSGCIPSKPYLGFATHVKERTETAVSSSYKSYGLPVRALVRYHVACSFV